MSLQPRLRPGPRSGSSRRSLRPLVGQNTPRRLRHLDPSLPRFVSFPSGSWMLEQFPQKKAPLLSLFLTLRLTLSARMLCNKLQNVIIAERERHCAINNKHTQQEQTRKCVDLLPASLNTWLSWLSEIICGSSHMI